MTGDEVAAVWDATIAGLDRPTVPRVAGQVAAFDVDVCSDVYEPRAVDNNGVQLGLFGEDDAR